SGSYLSEGCSGRHSALKYSDRRVVIGSRSITELAIGTVTPAVGFIIRGNRTGMVIPKCYLAKSNLWRHFTSKHRNRCRLVSCNTSITELAIGVPAPAVSLAARSNSAAQRTARYN